MEKYTQLKLDVEYDKRFSTWDVNEYITRNIPPSRVNSFDKIFHSSDVFNLVIGDISNMKDQGISNESARAYYDKLKSLGYFKKKSNKHDRELNKGGNIAELLKAGIAPERAILYPAMCDGREIALFEKHNITPETVNNYRRFELKWSSNHTLEDSEMGLPDLESIRVPDPSQDRFKAWEIVRMIDAGVKPENIDEYLEKFKGYQIAVLYKIGLTKSNGYNTKDLAFYKTATQLLKFKDITKHRDKYTLLDSGSSGFVLLKKDSGENCWKFSSEIEREYNLLKSIKSNNVVKTKSKAKNSKFIKLEYINGDSLENILKKRLLNSHEIINYSAGIINGLLDMKQAGTSYHRDINPRNIMIAKQNDRAVIIDLEYASENSDEPFIAYDLGNKSHNRRFNGPNDLSSLGQVMYTATTGTSIFAKSKPKINNLSDIADEISERRKMVYEDKTGVLMDLTKQKVDCTINDKKLSALIKELLIADKDDHKKIMERIK